MTNLTTTDFELKGIFPKNLKILINYFGKYKKEYSIDECILYVYKNINLDEKLL